VLDRLAAFKPDIITTEDLPGEECDLAARNPARYDPDYCAPTDAAKAATGLDIPAALAEVNKTLRAWPALGSVIPGGERPLLGMCTVAAAARG